ncbi:MAG: hypothetical protein EOP49_45650 [Sphingobacteriales bacterium]|nr:MAG: hypothetical protein EOP49_45650 [Sphingobacteriales bacterium]
MVQQALKRTTVSVLITDQNGRPYENNLNMTFINTVTEQPQYNFVHYYDAQGRADTLNVDPVLGYDLVVNTIPPLIRRDIKIEPGRHNQIKIPAPQGVLQFRQDGLSSTVPILAVVKQSGKEVTINHQPINIKENYLAGKYDIEVLTLPRLQFNDVVIKPNEATTLNVPIAGVMNIATSQEGFGSLYQLMDSGQQKWIYNFPGTNSRINLSLLPGKYRVAFRTKSAKGSEFTDTQDFTIRPGATTTVRLFTR